MKVVETTGVVRRAKLQSNRHHQQINTQLFTGRMPFQLNQQCQSTEGNIILRETNTYNLKNHNLHKTMNLVLCTESFIKILSHLLGDSSENDENKLCSL